jgi:hypothetical protein
MQSKAVLLAKNKFEQQCKIIPCGISSSPPPTCFFQNLNGLVQGENSIVKIKTYDKSFKEMLRNLNFPMVKDDMNKMLLKPDSAIIFEVFLIFFFFFFLS